MTDYDPADGDQDRLEDARRRLGLAEDGSQDEELELECDCADPGCPCRGRKWTGSP